MVAELAINITYLRENKSKTNVWVWHILKIKKFNSFLLAKSHMWLNLIKLVNFKVHHRLASNICYFSKIDICRVILKVFGPNLFSLLNAIYI